ncbi:transmembrane protein, putative [Medicago truncatula]|uniref:Transmembrane protein, putative n=1 Tax=Medicago truncatula TaxID=3880 RepID=G7K5Q6_MEDTR|nr:transmembrane protein, putative [Medicago truncatula]
MRSMLTQIVRWVTQPMIWRCVCFVSSVVGTVLLYSVFRFIFCLAILFANKWQNSNTSLPLKAHLVFLVFIITTVYSFFFDKANGKPDLYSLISGAAFAVMSLSLSKQTHFGFEVDLLYFFCGYLTLQLMKIKLVLYLVKPRESGGHLGLQIQDQTPIVIQIHQDSEQSSTGQVNFYETNTATEWAEIGSHIHIDAQQEDMALGPVTRIKLSSQKGKRDNVYNKLLTKTRQKVIPNIKYLGDYHHGQGDEQH